jgi:hypothetical protein
LGRVAVHNDFEQVVRGLFRDVFAQEQVIDDQKIGFGEERGRLLSLFGCVASKRSSKKVWASR